MIKAIYYHGQNKLYEVEDYQGFDTQTMISISYKLEKQEGIEPDLIEIAEDKDENVVQTWRRNFLNEWYVDKMDEIINQYPHLDLQSIEGFDCCIIGVVCLDSQEAILYDSNLIINMLSRGDLADTGHAEVTLMEYQRIYNECAFTDFPSQWFAKINMKG